MKQKEIEKETDYEITRALIRFGSPAVSNVWAFIDKRYGAIQEESEKRARETEQIERLELRRELEKKYPELAEKRSTLDRANDATTLMTHPRHPPTVLAGSEPSIDELVLLALDIIGRTDDNTFESVPKLRCLLEYRNPQRGGSGSLFRYQNAREKEKAAKDLAEWERKLILGTTGSVPAPYGKDMTESSVRFAAAHVLLRWGEIGDGTVLKVFWEEGPYQDEASRRTLLEVIERHIHGGGR